MTRWLARAGALALLALAACVPPRLPPQLEATPGPPVIVADRVTVAGLFSVRPPAGWRVITGPASGPPQVVFAPADSAALIALGVGEGFAAPDLPGAERSAARSLDIGNGLRVEAILRAPADGWEAYAAVFERVLRSVQAVQQAEKKPSALRMLDRIGI